jgi:hypothetical protein
MWVQITEGEFDTVLAALRTYQVVMTGRIPPMEQVRAILDLAKEHGEPLGNPAIDLLCEALNTETRFTDEEMAAALEVVEIAMADDDTYGYMYNTLVGANESLPSLEAKIQSFMHHEEAHA